MHLVRVLGYTLLLVSNVILAAGADAAYIKSSLLNMTADIDVIKATASTIDTNLDFLSYQVGGGKYKQVQDKLNALTTKAGTYSSQIQGSSVSSPTDIDEIVNSFQVLGIELIATLGVLIDKAGAFATTPLLGQDISNSIGGFEGGFGLYNVNIRALNSDISNRIVGTVGAVFILFPVAENKYKGVVC